MLMISYDPLVYGLKILQTRHRVFLAQHIHIRVKQHSYQSQLTTHVITRELSLNNYTSQKLGKETKSSRYVKSRSKRNIYRHRKWRHKVQEMVGYIGFCFSDGVSHSKWRKQKAWIFFSVFLLLATVQSIWVGWLTH